MSTTTHITVRAPLQIQRRPGRKTVAVPLGDDGKAVLATCADPALMKALARGFRWRRMLEDGRYASVSDLARGEKIDRGFAGTLLRLTLLAPDVVEAILDGRQPAELALSKLMQPFPLDWTDQRIRFGFPETSPRGQPWVR